MGIPEAIGMGASALGIGAGVKAAKGGKKNAPPPPDFMGLAREQGAQNQALLQQQTAANRPNQSTPFATSQWAQGPDGQWSQQVSLSGPLSGLSQSLQQQAASSMSSPLDFSSLGAMPSGEAALRQATDASYNQATSRLDPRFAQEEERLRTRLANQGITESSAAWDRAMSNLGKDRNDAYNQAMFSSQREGVGAGQALFNQGMATRQQGMAEILRRRGQAMSDLQGLQGFTSMPGFATAGQGQAPNLLGAAGLQDSANMGRYQLSQQQMADALGAIMQLAGTAGMAASDERLKRNVRRYDVDLYPGVPLASWEWAGEPLGPTWGVVAQDLQQAAPELVHEGPDGMLMVDYSFLGGR